MSKLAKTYKQECKKLSKTMLYATMYLGADGGITGADSIMEFNFSNFFPGYSDLHATLIAGSRSATVSFSSRGELVELGSLFTFKQLAKLGFDSRYCLHFDDDEAEAKLYKTLKYLYKNN